MCEHEYHLFCTQHLLHVVQEIGMWGDGGAMMRVMGPTVPVVC